MSADIINLRQARKKKSKAEQGAKADQNRALFGRTKAEKQLSQKSENLEAKRLDAHRLEASDGPSPEKGD
ncbi:DUF4169 family protein [Roseibium algae]|uniref:DUF4169 family protein n=1 Tax=Roseibium algae TaxID=3123038 RepID=A0ABU8TKL7_9HYPH